MTESAAEISRTDSPSRWSGAWSLLLLVGGLAMIAACVLAPQADANRRLLYEREKLQLDLTQIQQQVAMNRQFLAKIETDPQLEERLALRQMRVVRQGERVLDIKTDDADADQTPEAGTDAAQMSPFSIVHVPAPDPLPAYPPWGGWPFSFFLQPHSQLCILGAALWLIAAGLVLGDNSNNKNHRLAEHDGDNQ
jgi:hypothetical protein